MQPISKAESDPTQGPVYLQHPKRLFQHPKAHAFLPPTPPNVDPGPCLVACDNPTTCSLRSCCRSYSFQSTTQFCAPPSLSYSLLTPTSSARFPPVPTDDTHTDSPQPNAHRHLRWTPHHAAVPLAASFPLQMVPLRQSLREAGKSNIWH